MSANSAMAMPSASSSAVSKLSARRRRHVLAGFFLARLRQDDAVHHHVDVVLVFLVELGRLGDLVELPVDLDALEALLLQLGQLLAVLALAAAHDGRQQVEPRALRQRQHPVDHLLHGLALDRQAGGRRVGHADAGEQQAQVVVDLGDRADGGARVLGGGLLLDGDGRRQPVDVIDVGLLHHLQELARVGRQALHVAPLPLGIDGVEGERGLARARQPREHDQRVARDLEVDILQVVLARAADVDRPMGIAHGDTLPRLAGSEFGSLAHGGGSSSNSRERQRSWTGGHGHTDKWCQTIRKTNADGPQFVIAAKLDIAALRQTLLIDDRRCRSQASPAMEGAAIRQYPGL